jgi:dCTP deaminase
VLLSDHDIRVQIESGRVRLDPYDEVMIQPASGSSGCSTTTSTR